MLQVIGSSEPDSGSNCGRDLVHGQQAEQCNESRQQINSVSKNWRHLQPKSHCQRITEPAQSISGDESRPKNASSSVCSRDEQKDSVTESDEYQSNGYNHGAKQNEKQMQNVFEFFDLYKILN